MSSRRINISLPEEVLKELTQEVETRKRSRFIAEAVAHALRGKRARTLAAEYQEAAAEIRRVNRELEGTITDGLD